MTLPAQRFSRDQRIRSSADFEAVYAARCKAADGVLLVFALQNGQEYSRLGLSVSRKHGGAVVRNQLKRWLREAYRTQQDEIPKGLDLVVVPLDRKRASAAIYRDSFRKLAQRLARRLNESAS